MRSTAVVVAWQAADRLAGCLDALHTSMPWPKGVPTRPEVDQEHGGTTPGDFARDHLAVAELLRRFAPSDLSTARHPVFGTMTRAEWLVWGYRHVDHHLRQFGL